MLSATGWTLFDEMVDRTLTGRTWSPGNDGFDQAWPLTVPTDIGDNCGASTSYWIAVYGYNGACGNIVIDTTIA